MVSRRTVFSMAGAAAGFTPRAALAASPMDWWTQSRFGMFIHWGVHTIIARDIWNMEHEAIPPDEYRQLGKMFRPPAGCAREWARLARETGQKYMVLTTKNHDGYCLFDTKTTDFCATKQACGRDLVAEFVEAARAEGRRVGFYFSMMDWIHPDGIRCVVDEAARRRFVEYTHAQVHEICSNYGKIDILWWDGAWPLNAEGWEAEKLQKWIREKQPGIIINDRGGLKGDFTTSEQKIEPAEEGRAWEACMTINGAWGYVAGDENWKSPQTILSNLITCARGGGNFILNISPKSNGSVPEGSVRVLEQVGRWMAMYGDTIYGTERCKVSRSNYLNFTRKQNTLYLHVTRWPGKVITLARFTSQVKSARWVASGQPVRFEQARENDPREPELPFPLYRVKFFDLPETAPGMLPVIAVEFDAEPAQDVKFPRWGKK
jgi:alpha-L-fucosidase